VAGDLVLGVSDAEAFEEGGCDDSGGEDGVMRSFR
jgi:hypothetical protein